MLFVIVGISFCVHLYSIEYMYNDPHLIRFLSFCLYLLFMIVLVTSKFITVVLWVEGVGLCSYLLINFWYTRIAINKAAIKALIINKLVMFVYYWVLFYFFCFIIL